MISAREEQRYYDFRVSFVALGVFALFLAALGLGILLDGLGIKHVVLLAAGAAVLALVGSIRICVTAEEVQVTYGIGLWSYVIRLSDIESCGIPPNSFVRTWIYCPFGKFVLELRLRNGERVLLPADEPKDVAAIIKNPRRGAEEFRPRGRRR